MAELRRRALEGQLIQQWKEIEDLEEDEAEDHFKSRKEQWFLQAFSFLRDLPEESHCWCGHKEIMLPLLEPFYSYYQETVSNSSLKVLWRRLSKEMRRCTRCVVQHHKAKEFYASEFVEEVVKPLMDIVRALDEERVARHMKELLLKFDTDTLDPKEDSYEVICIMFEVLMFPFLLEDAEINETVKPFLRHVEETHDLSLAAGQRYPGVYSLLLDTDQGVRRIALKLAHSLPTFKDEQDMESIQPVLEKCMHSLEYDTFDSRSPKTEKAGHGRPRAVFTKEALWIGLTTILSVLEPPAFLKGVMEKYPMFVSIVLNHVSEATGVFWNALRCLKLLLEVLGYKLWLGTSFSPGVMRNTLLSQCFHSREERMHVHIFDLFQPFLQSLEALQDGEYENQRRGLLYFLLQQVPLSSNFKPLMTKKARQVAFTIIGRGYSMDPPLPPVECVHVWGPPLVATLKDTGLVASLKKTATDLMQSIIVADAAALAAVCTRPAPLQKFGKYVLESNDDDIDEAPEETADSRTEGVGDANYWISFLSVTRSVEACEQWSCLPLLWVDVLNGIMPMHLPLSFTKGIMWALGRLSLVDLRRPVTPANMVVTSDGVACSKDMSAAFKWVKPKGYDDGASGEGCVNAVKVETHHEELIEFLKKYAEKYLTRLQEGGYEQGDWAWEARMAEPCILLPLDANATFREFGKEVLRRTGNGSSTLEAGLELLCSSKASAAAVTRGLHHALKLLLHWPPNQCSRGLQQLFFHVWKLLTLGDKELDKRPSPVQASQEGGFLNEPRFKTLSLGTPPGSQVNKLQKDEEAWRKLCTVVAWQLWPLLEKTIIEGRQHLEGAGQLMTFTRMLQLLPCVFRNLSPVQKKKVFLGTSASRSVGGDSSELTWFRAFIRWGDVPSPIIQRWWKEAVGSILEDLKGWELVLSSELEDMIVDLRKSGLQLDEARRLQLMSLLLSVPTLVLNHKFLDRELPGIPVRNENAQGPKGDQENTCVPDSSDILKASSAQHHLIDLTDDEHVRYYTAPKEVINLDDYPESSSSPSAMLDGRDDALPSQQLDVGVNEAAPEFLYNAFPEHGSTGLTQNSTDREPHEKPEEPQFRRPSVRQAPVSSRSSKSATLDNFLVKFYSEQAKRDANKGSPQVQGLNRTFKPPAAKSATGKPQKVGSKLSSLRNEHREDLEQRSAVEGLVRSQVRERVEKEATAVRSDDKRHLSVPAPVLVPPATSGTDPGLRSNRPLNTVLRELVRDNEVDPLDAAFENVRKTRLVGLTEAAVKPKRKLITLEMPGESGRGGNVGKPQAGLVIQPRQIPRLDDWYRRILSLDYLSVVGISDENTSPRSNNTGDQLEKVPLFFKSPEQYMRIFRPLVLEEFKSQLQRSHEELHLSDGTTTGILRLMSLERVDDFQVGRFMAEAGSDGAARACADNELLLLSRQSLQSGPQSCHLLAKVESRDRESKSRATVLLLKLFIQTADARLTKAKRLLVERSKWFVTRIMNITPQLRECQALSSLSSLPLLPVLLSPGSGHKATSLENVSLFASLRSLPEPLQNKLRQDYNESQLRAIAAVIGGTETMTNHHQLTLVQGPPGTGKTKTIVGILSALLGVRSSKRNSKPVKENESPIPRSSLSSGRTSAIKSSSRDAAAVSRAWQDAARARDIETIKESENHSLDFQGQKQRVLVCAQSNAAVDEIVARICKNGLYGVDGSFFRPIVVRVGTSKSVHPKSLPVFIDTLVDQRLGSEKETEAEAVDEKEQSKLAGCRSKLEEVIEFIQVIEALRSQSKDTEEGEKTEQKTGLSESAFGAKALNVIAMGEAAVTGKLNVLYRQRRALTAEVVTAEKEGKKAYEESKNRRKSIRKDIIRQADVVVTTLSGCGGDIYTVCMESLAGGKKKSKPVQECFFDAVVIDEAAQALEPATLIPFQLLVQSNARCVMVGDPKQLPATVLSQMASRMQYECSMFERLQRAGYPVTMLSTQYRMHPEIRQFPSAHFYDDLITDGEGLTASRKAIFHREASFGPYVFFNVVDGQESRKGGSASQSLSNEAEVAVALQLYLTLKKRYPAELWEGRVGVITPYKQQLGLLREEFVRTLGASAASEVEFNTVDGFQGREVDILILSTVRASSSLNSTRGDIGFVADIRRMNVALTRARYSMWIIGNAATLQANSSWASLLSNAKRRSVIFSVNKPYASFFQKKVLVDTSETPESSRFINTTERHRISKVVVDGQVTSNSNLQVSPGRSKENRANSREGVGTRIREEPGEVNLSKGSERLRESSRPQVGGNRYDREGSVRSSMKDSRASEVRVPKDSPSRESSHDRHEERSGNETKRRHIGQDRARADSMMAERSVDDKLQDRSRQDGSSDTSEKREKCSRLEKQGNHFGKDKAREGSSQRFAEVKNSNKSHYEGSSGRNQSREETPRADSKQRHSHQDGSAVEGRSQWRSQSQRDTGGDRNVGNSNPDHQQQRQKQNGAALEEKAEDRSRRDGGSGYNGRYVEGSPISDRGQKEHPRDGHNSGKMGHRDDGRNIRNSGEKAHTRDHRLDGNGGDRSREPTGSRQTDVLKDGDERKEPPRDRRLVSREEPAVVRDNRSTNGVGPVHNSAPKAVSEVMRTGSQTRRTSQEELSAARKRKREEVAALLPSGLLTSSSKKPGSAVLSDQQFRANAHSRPAPERRATHSTGQVNNQSSVPNRVDMGHEWHKYQKVLGESKPSTPLARAQADSAQGVSTKAIRKPVKDSEQPAAKETKPLSDLDNILSGLSSVARAQAKGSKLEAPSKLTMPTSGSKSVAPKHF